VLWVVWALCILVVMPWYIHIDAVNRYEDYKRQTAQLCVDALPPLKDYWDRFAAGFRREL
jgi:4-amino-4-deoxy-L-arabinose transferase-like glycosyltransferase